MSNENEDEDIQCFLDVELETLRSIYINELEILCDEGCPTSVMMQLYPSTADNVDEQYVRMSLIITLPLEYPDIIPDIQIKNPRGLSDEKLQRILDDLFSKAEERKGGTMLFELIECAKDHLTAGNRPSCQCAICLYGFTEQDVFTKTKCYHYFHSHCLSCYVTHQMKEAETEKPVRHSEVKNNSKEVLCPVCRIPISFSFVDDCNFPAPVSAKDDSFMITEELKQLQCKMADLYEKQKIKGGIIDVEAEKKKFLLEISSVSSKVKVLPETEHLNTMQKNSSDEKHQNISQRKRENDLAFSKTTKISNSLRNNVAGNSESTNRYQKHNQKGKDSKYVPSKSSKTRNYEILDECDSKHTNLAEQFKGGKFAGAKAFSDPEHAVDLQKSTQVQNSETEEIGLAAVNVDITIDMCSADNTVESIKSKHQHSGRTNFRPLYHRRYHNYNRRSNFHKQRQYVDADERKCTSSEFCGPFFDRHVSLSNRKNENHHHCGRQNDSYHQQRNISNSNQRFQSAENSHQQRGRRANFHEYRQQEDSDHTPRQNYNYSQSGQALHRRPNYHSYYGECERYERNQQIIPDNTEKTDYDNCKDHHIGKTSLVQNDKSYSELKPVEIRERNIKDNLRKVSKNQCLLKCPESYINDSDTIVGNDFVKKTDKQQSECHRYQNKNEGRGRSRINSSIEHQDSTPTSLENNVEKIGSGASNKISVSPDVYIKHPFKRPDGKMRIKDYESRSSENMRIGEVNEICDVSYPIVDTTSNCNNEIFNLDMKSLAVNSPEGKNMPSHKNADIGHSLSRPPPGFAKKVVYGLPSVKPPPGFSLS